MSKKKKVKLKSFIVSHSIDTTVVVDAVDDDDAMEKAEVTIRAVLDTVDEHAQFRVCDVSNNN